MKLRSIAILSIVALCSVTLWAADPTIPSPLNVQYYDGTTVRFSWGESSGQVDGYRIYWGKSEGGPYPKRLCDVNRTTQQYTVSLNKAWTYHLICRAYNQYGESGDSEEVCWPE